MFLNKQTKVVIIKTKIIGVIAADNEKQNVIADLVCGDCCHNAKNLPDSYENYV